MDLARHQQACALQRVRWALGLAEAPHEDAEVGGEKAGNTSVVAHAPCVLGVCYVPRACNAQDTSTYALGVAKAKDARCQSGSRVPLRHCGIECALFVGCAFLTYVNYCSQDVCEKMCVSNNL